MSDSDPAVYRAGMDFRNTLTWVVVVGFCIWVLYLLYKIAQHVGAWPFG